MSHIDLVNAGAEVEVYCRKAWEVLAKKIEVNDLSSQI